MTDPSHDNAPGSAPCTGAAAPGVTDGAAARHAVARRETILISLVTALCLLGDSFLYIALPLHWREAGLSSIMEVGAILALNRLVRIPLNPLITRLYDRFSCRAGILAATALALATTAGYGLCTGLLAWVLLRVFWGLAWTFLRLGTLFTIVRLGTPADYGQLTGLNNGLYRLGSLGGMLLGGILSDSMGMRAALILAAMTAAAPVMATLFLRPGAGDPARPGARGDAPDGRPSARGGRVADDPPAAGSAVPAALGRADFAWLMLMAAVVAMTYQGVVGASLSLLVEAHLGRDIALLGLALSCGALTGLLQALRWGWEPFLAPWCGRLSDRHGRGLVTAISFLLAAATMAAPTLSLPLWPWLAALAATQLAATALTTASDTQASAVASASPSPRRVVSAYALFTDVGAAAGPVLACAAVTLGGVDLAWGGCAAVLAMMALRWFLRPPCPGPRAR